MIVFASLILLMSLAFITCVIIAGRCLSKRRAHIFCIVVAALVCTSVPFGTALGVCTIIVLCRPSVKEQFARGRPDQRDEDEDDWGQREAPAERERPRSAGAGDDRYYSR
jgi:hypothetical protein